MRRGTGRVQVTRYWLLERGSLSLVGPKHYSVILFYCNGMYQYIHMHAAYPGPGPGRAGTKSCFCFACCVFSVLFMFFFIRLI